MKYKVSLISSKESSLSFGAFNLIDALEYFDILMGRRKNNEPIVLIEIETKTVIKSIC